MKGNKSICLRILLLLVLQNIPQTRQIKNGVGGNFRKLNDFDYNFQDWDVNGTQNNLFDYNIDLENLGKQDAVTNPYPPTNTTPIIYVTIPTAPKAPAAETTTILPDIFPEMPRYDIDVTSVASEGTIKVNFVSLASGSTIPDVATVALNLAANGTVPTLAENTRNVSTTLAPENVTETTELIMTFPETTATEGHMTTLPDHLTIYTIHYPPDMTFPQFGITTVPPSTLPFQAANSYLFTTITEPTTTESAVVREFKLDMEQINAGYLTTFLLALFKIIPEKTPKAAQYLFHMFEREVVQLEATRKLAGFGKSTVVAFLNGGEMLNSVPPDVVQGQAAVGKYLMMNRDSLSPEVTALLEEADKLYRPDEGKRILKVVEDLYEYPNTTKTAREIVHEVLEAVILAPFKRLYGTTKEKILVQQLDAMVIKLYFSGFPVGGRRQQSGKRTTEQTRKKKNITTWNQRTKRIKTLPTPLTKTRSTILTTLPRKYAVYSKNETIRDAFKERMMRYKKKRDPNRWRQWRSKRTTTTTTTEKPTKVTRKFKSIYVIKRYVHKKLKRRKVKIVRNETGTFELVDYEDDLANVSKVTLSKDTVKDRISTQHTPKRIYSVNNKVFSQKTFKNIPLNITNNKKGRQITKGRNRAPSYARNKTQINRIQIKNKLINNTLMKNENKLKAKERRRLYPDISKRYTVLKRNNLNKNIKLRTFLPNNDNMIEDSSLTEEEKLKANLDDALFHEKPIPNPDFENFGRRKIDSSYSDDETVLKSRIYKVFGYENDFAEALRQGKRRRQFK